MVLKIYKDLSALDTYRQGSAKLGSAKSSTIFFRLAITKHVLDTHFLLVTVKPQPNVQALLDALDKYFEFCLPRSSILVRVTTTTNIP